MSDIECPYCGYWQEINHDDGYGYEEDCTHEQECVDCERVFKYTTSISYSYSTYCDESVVPHNWEECVTNPDYLFCSRCEACMKKPAPSGNQGGQVCGDEDRCSDISGGRAVRAIDR